MVDESQSNTDNVDQLHDELISMPGFKVVRQIESINTSVYIFDQNYAELIAALEFFISDPKSIPLTFQRNRDKLYRMQLEILRRLHNFVAASQTLIDHTRNYYKEEYLNSDKFQDYQAKIESEFTKDSLSQFIKGLRIYCQHYYPPNIVVQESIHPNPDGTASVTKNVVLRKENLITFDGWSSTAKKFFVQHGKDIDILEVAKNYRTKVTDFYKWFIDRQKQIHIKELRQVEQKQNEFIQSHIEFLINSRLRQKCSQASIEEEIFSGIISSNEIVELETLIAPPDKKADFAVVLLSRHYPIPESLRLKITNLYRQEEYR